MGADLLGTGVTFIKGKNFPPYEYMENAIGYADIRFAKWLYEKGIRGWALPKPQNYITSTLSEELYQHSLFESFGKKTAAELAGVERRRKKASMSDVAVFKGKSAHSGKRYSSFMRQKAKS